MVIKKILKKDIELICSLNQNWTADSLKVKRVGGWTNRNYFLQSKKQKRFIKIPWEKAEIVDREIEAQNLLALARSKKLTEILPEYYIYIFKKKNILSGRKKIFNLPDGTMVMEYIEGKDLDGKDLKNEKIQKSLVKTLYTFHTSSVKFENIYDVFRDELFKYKMKAKNYSTRVLIEDKRIEKIEEIENRIKEEFSPAAGISTHNDLIFENLRLGKDGKIYLLDFEYAGFNVRDGLYYDLRIILGGNLFQKNPIEIETFEEILKKARKIYKKDLDSRKIYYGALTNILVMFWWGMVKYFSSPTKEDKKYFKNYVLKRARRALYLHDFINRKF